MQMKIIRSIDRPVQIEREMLANAGLSLFEKGLCAYLEYMSEDGPFEMSMEDLAYMGNCSEEFMKKTIDKLKKKGYVASREEINNG